MKLRLLFIAFLSVLVFIRVANGYSQTSGKVVFTSSLLSAEALKIVSGHVPGLVADFKLLHVFSLFNEMKKNPGSDYGLYLYENLTHASDLDSKFQDVYRLASSILAFDAAMPKEAVTLLEKGSYAIPNQWDTPFLGGFIAFEQVGDAQKAFELMSLAATREHAPPFIALLAAKYLSNEVTVQETISFLEGFMKMMPEEHQLGILQRINELKEEVK